MPPNKYIHTYTSTVHTYIEYLEIGGQQAPVFVHGMHQDERHIYLLVLNVIPVLEQMPPLTSTLAFIPTYIHTYTHSSTFLSFSRKIRLIDGRAAHTYIHTYIHTYTYVLYICGRITNNVAW
jgi:hypothetical protein